MYSNKLRISTRLGLAFGAILMVTALIAIIGYFQLDSMKTVVHQLASTELERNELAVKWTANIKLNLVRSAAALQSESPDFISTLQKEMDITSKTIGEIQKKIVPLIQDEIGKNLIIDIGKMRELYRGPRAELMKKKGAGEDVSSQFKVMLQPLAENYLNSLVKLEEHMNERLTQSVAQTNIVATYSQWSLIIGASISILLSLLLAYFVSRSITRPLSRAVSAAQSIMKGDLCADINADGKDETAQLLMALLAMRDNLALIVAEVRDHAQGVSASSSEIADGTNDLSSRTEEQAASLEETAATMEELTSAVKQNADNATQANRLAESASQVAVRGGVVVSQVVDTMDSINASAKKIVDIVALIDGITFQTNILALNAAVEAARAGELGRGFAVVASEVRNLAQRSAGAAKEIKTLIGDSVEKIKGGTELVAQAGATMNEIVASVTLVTDIMSEIAAASHQQRSGIGQVSQTIIQMDVMTQKNAAMVEEATAAAMSLNEQASSLFQAVSVFKLDHTDEIEVNTQQQSELTTQMRRNGIKLVDVTHSSVPASAKWSEKSFIARRIKPALGLREDGGDGFH
jgi:methyl-accepting chemotaxis protein